MSNKQQVVLALLSGKGGSGKTVLALSMARVMVEAGFTVTLVDCDIATHGASYFLEPQIEEANYNIKSLVDFTKECEGEIYKSSYGFHFVPSIMDHNDIERARLLESSNNAIIAFKNILVDSIDADVILLDCQAGFSTIVSAAARIAARNLIVLEPDAVSAAALRVLYLQLGTLLKPNSTWQIFNKLTEAERPVYEHVSGVTIFPSLLPIPFDWEIRAAFATRDVPGILTASSAFGLGVLRIMQKLFPEFASALRDLEKKHVGDWYNDISTKLDILEHQRNKLKFEFIEQKRRQRVARLKFLPVALLVFPLLYIINTIGKYYGVNIFFASSTIFTLFTVAAGIWYYTIAMRDIRLEYEQDRAQEALSDFEKESDRYRTLIATDPGLKEYSRDMHTGVKGGRI